MPGNGGDSRPDLGHDFEHGSESHALGLADYQLHYQALSSQSNAHDSEGDSEDHLSLLEREGGRERERESE
jgi:hypothetical protein